MASLARPCAARTRLFGFIAMPNGALRAPHPPPIAASLLLIRPPKIFTIYRTWAANVKGFFFPLDHRGYEIGSPLPPAHRTFADPSGNIFGVKLCTNATRRDALIFSVFPFFYSFRILFLLFSYFSSLLFLFLFFLFFSSYPSLLISSYSSRRCYSSSSSSPFF